MAAGQGCHGVLHGVGLAVVPHGHLHLFLVHAEDGLHRSS